MADDNGVRAGSRASHEAADASSPKASIPDAALVEEARDLGAFLLEVKADIPEPTCSSIDAVLREVAEPRRLADKYSRNIEVATLKELSDFAQETDTLLWSLPDSLEGLRSDNCQLRDGVHHLGSYCHEAGKLLLQLAQAIEARSVETEGLDPKDESAVACDAPQTQEQP